MNEQFQINTQEILEKQAILRKKVQEDPWRLHFHQMPETGWLNDPNGVIQFKGIYHLYHQFAPISPEGGLIHWGHKTSKDLVHFEEEAIFLSPDKHFNKDGVYSGSAFIKGDELHFFYTGNVLHDGDHDYTFSGREQNTVHVISKDGFTIDYEEVVISSEEYPEEYTNHIRDPKVFERDGKYYMILGARRLDHRGAILLYVSEDLSEWKYAGTFLEALTEEMGFMWECPDYFKVTEKDVLIFSPQGIKNNELYTCQNRYQAGFILGHIKNEEYPKFIPETDFKELDYGFDFYAPQTFEDEKGRRILWGWMGLGDISPEYSNPTIARGWQHAMTMPRELTVESGELKQRPLLEYQILRQNKRIKEIDVKELVEMPIKQQDVFEMKLTKIKVQDSFSITLKEDTILSFDGEVFRMQHGVSGFGRSTRGVILEKGLDSLHIFVDTSSIEIFINDGSYVMTSRVYPKKNKQSILFKGQYSALVTLWDLIE